MSDKEVKSMFNPKNIFILLSFIVFTTLISQPSNFYYENVSESEVADSNIFSPKNHRYIDEEATNKLKLEAIDSVQDVYIESNEIHEVLAKDFESFILSVITTKEEISQKQSEFDKNNKRTSKDVTVLKDFESAKIDEIPNNLNFSKEDIIKFMELEATELSKVKEIMSKELKRIFGNQVTSDNLETVKSQFKNNTNFYYFFSQEVTNTLVDKLATRIEPNFLLDAVETDKRKVEASNNIDDVYKVIKKGEMIVSIGDVVTEEQVKKLEELGFIKTEWNYFEVFKQLPYFTLIFVLFYIYCFYFYKKQFTSMKSYLFLLISISLVVALTSFIKDTFFSPLPLLTLLMIYMVFWGRKFVVFASIILGLLLGIGDFVFLSLTLIAGIVLTLSFSSSSKRINLIFSGISVGITLFIADMIVYFSLEQTLNFESHLSFLLAAFGASVITVGLIPVLENILGLVTSVRLYELSDPNHPLLKRLMREALGTYTHSLMVGNLAEMAAEEIKANGLLLRVGAYFHDVGKLINPEYFIENSTPQSNPHNKLNPKESAHIIRQHPKDSVKLCREFKIPEPIIDLIASHHGDAVLHHLYEPAKLEDPSVSIEEFRYQTPTPKTKEEGILLLADSTEAYSRVLLNKSKEEIESKIREMILQKVKHGTLRDCDLTLKDLNKIINTFTNYLVNSNHKRISYSSDEKDN